MKNAKQHKLLPRGRISVKGKGWLQTYFLVSNGKLSIADPPIEAMMHSTDTIKMPQDKDMPMKKVDRSISNGFILKEEQSECQTKPGRPQSRACSVL